MSNILRKPIKEGTKLYGVSYCGKPNRHAREAFQYMAHRHGYKGSFAVADGLAIVWLYNSLSHAEKALKKAISVGIGDTRRSRKMTFKEFRRWANRRACDGLWSFQHALAAEKIYEEMNRAIFKRRHWKTKCESRAVALVKEVTDIFLERLKDNDGALRSGKGYIV